jgi:hypothetical protein
MPHALASLALAGLLLLASPPAQAHFTPQSQAALQAVRSDKGAALAAGMRGGASPPATDAAAKQEQREQLYEAYNMLHSLAQVRCTFAYTFIWFRQAIAARTMLQRKVEEVLLRACQLSF